MQQCGQNQQQAEAEVVPSSSLVEVEVGVGVEVGFGVEVGVGVVVGRCSLDGVKYFFGQGVWGLVGR